MGSGRPPRLRAGTLTFSTAILSISPPSLGRHGTRGPRLPVVPLRDRRWQADFDTATDLRQKYGVTVQHTFLQIDAEGTELAKWSGSVTADEIAQNTV